MKRKNFVIGIFIIKMDLKDQALKACWYPTVNLKNKNINAKLNIYENKI